MKKTEKDLNEELLIASLTAIHAYEKYLLDEVGWKELAKIMNNLKMHTDAITKRKTTD